MPLYYLADATITLLRRLIAGEKVTEGHRSHFYQRAGDLGWAVPAITHRIFAVNAGLAVLAVTAAMTSQLSLQLLLLLCALLLTASLLRTLSRSPLS